MEGERLSRFPHLAWIPFRVVSRGDSTPFVFSMRGVVHTISLTVRGSHAVRWLTGRREITWSEPAGAVHFVPADGGQRAFVTSMSPDFESAVLFIPESHLADCLAAEGLAPPHEPRRILVADDAVLQSCIARLAGRVQSDDPPGPVATDETARRLVLRLMELHGGRRPDWHDDASQFDRSTMRGLVEYIDAHLRVCPTVSELGMRVGLSPSHFARKFRRSTGLSLQRFVNRRRLRVSLRMLADGSLPLPMVAVDLGFSSQSHFTRLFSDQTGMTPARFRKHAGRVVG